MKSTYGCLLVSDLHYTLKQFDWVLTNANDFDIVVIAGDHLDISSTVDLRAQIAVIQTYLRRLGSEPAYRLFWESRSRCPQCRRRKVCKMDIESETIWNTNR